MAVVYQHRLDERDLRTIQIADLLDPHKHEYHRWGAPVTVGEWVTQMRVLCDYSNVTRHPKAFFRNAERHPTHIQTLICQLEDDVLYELTPFVYFGMTNTTALGYVPLPNVSIASWPQYQLFQGGNLDHNVYLRWARECKEALSQMWNMNCNIIARLIDLGGLGGFFAAMISGQGYVWTSDGMHLKSISALRNARYSIRYEEGQGSIYLGDFIESGTQPEDRRHLYQVFSYRTNPQRELGKDRILSEKTDKKTGKTHNRNRDNLLYGIELELSTNHSVRSIIDSQEFPFFLCKQDGSVSGAFSTNIECVTVPMDYRNQRQQWGKFFSKFWDAETKSYRGFDSTTDTSNGMHIHMTKAAFSEVPGHLERFCWFIADPANYDFILALSERGAALNEYCRLPDFSSRESRKQMFTKIMEKCRATGRGAINVSTSTGITIELRLFKGIVSYASLLKNLEFADALYHFTMVMPYSKITVDDFVDWVNGKMKNCPCPRKYKALRLFLAGIDHTIYQKVRCSFLLLSCVTEEDAIRMVSKNKLPLTKILVDNLNRRFPRRRGSGKTFSIKNGTLMLNPDLYSQLKSFEDELNPFNKKLKAAA